MYRTGVELNFKYQRVSKSKCLIFFKFELVTHKKENKSLINELVTRSETLFFNFELVTRSETLFFNFELVTQSGSLFFNFELVTRSGNFYFSTSS